jgi:hypothetical protein
MISAAHTSAVAAHPCRTPQLPVKTQISHSIYNTLPNAISFKPAIVSTSGRLHSEFVRILFLRAQRESDRFFVVSGIQFPEHNRGDFNSLPPCDVLQSRKKTGCILTKKIMFQLPITFLSLGVPVHTCTQVHWLSQPQPPASG